MFKAVPQLDIDARTYDQNPDYVEDVLTANVTTLVEITTLIDKWQDKAFDPTYGNAIEMELKVATSTTRPEGGRRRIRSNLCNAMATGISRAIHEHEDSSK